MKRQSLGETPRPWKRYCSEKPQCFVEPINTDRNAKPEENRKKEFYEGVNGIITLKPNVVSIVDRHPRVLNQYVLAALKKNGPFFAQTRSLLLGPFYITPTPADLPKGELIMIYESCGSFSETRMSIFRPLGLFQN